MKICTVRKKEILYVVSDRNGNFSHGKTIKQARKDLVYKTIAKFDGTLPKKAAVKEWIGIYRVVTGACSVGVQMFVEKNSYDLEKIMTAKEVAEAIGNSYGATKFKELVK